MNKDIKFKQEIFVNLKLISSQKRNLVRKIKLKELESLNIALNDNIKISNIISFKLYPKLLTIIESPKIDEKFYDILNKFSIKIIETKYYIFLRVDNVYFVQLRNNNISFLLKFFIYSSFSYFKNILYLQKYLLPSFYTTKLQIAYFNIFPRTKLDKYFRIKKINKSEFLDLSIESQDSFNLMWRKEHLKIITNDFTHFKLNEIWIYLKEIDTSKLLIKEFSFSQRLLEPISHNHHFWGNGNNLLLNSYIYGFRNGVIPYNNLNDLYVEGIKTSVYSSDYYKNLPKMTITEVENLTKNYPLEIKNDILISGRHRALAMLKWLEEHDEYIPFYATY